MIVVPLEKDQIITKDGQSYVVVEYTNFKEGGPAVYATDSEGDLLLVYFFDIAEINGTTVEYQRGSKVFNALGKIKRKQHLPQPDDKVTIAEHESIEVKGLKLKSKTLGINRGMFIQDNDGNYYRLKQVLSLDRAIGSSNFDRDSFLQIYRDYIGV